MDPAMQERDVRRGVRNNYAPDSEEENRGQTDQVRRHAAVQALVRMKAKATRMEPPASMARLFLAVRGRQTFPRRAAVAACSAPKPCTAKGRRSCRMRPRYIRALLAAGPGGVAAPCARSLC